MPYVTIRGRKLHYRDEGKGFPLLFGHSYLWNAAMWGPQVAHLRQHYRCIVPELWSHGLSDCIEGGSYSVESLAEDYALLLEALKINRVIVVGLSVGGMWGLELALRYPDKVLALAMMDSFVGAEPAPTQKEYLTLIDAVEQQQAFTPQIAAQIVPLFFSSKTYGQNPLLITHFTELLESYSRAQVPGITAIGRGIFTRTDKLDALAELTIPTLFVVGEDDKPRPVSESEEMLKRVASAELLTVPDAGHVSNLEQPQLVTEKLEAFIEQVLVPCEA